VPLFVDRMLDALRVRGPLAFGLDPSGELLEQWGLGDTPDGLDRFVDIVLEATVGVVGVVKPQAAFYERHGWHGWRSLTRLVESAREAGLIVLLDAKRGDVGSTMRAYAEAYLWEGAALAVDAITVNPYLGFGTVAPFSELAVKSDAGVFVVVRSTNPDGRTIQDSVGRNGLPVEEQLVSDIASANRDIASSGLGPIGAVFGPGHGPPGFDIRAMNGLFLAPGVGAQGATAKDVAACFESCPDRVIASSSRGLLTNGPDPAELKNAAELLTAELRGSGVGP
jgi:orotidine-5'-phosphate decarboxylase